MKKIKYLFLLMLSLLIIPFGVYAEGEEEVVSDDVSREAIIYFFRGEGCSHCAEAEAWFSSIEESMGDKFQIIDFETWNSVDNADLMTRVAKARGEEEQATGVPYIIIGDKSWIGFDQDYTSEMIDKIEAVYQQDPSERYDVMNYVEQAVAPKEKESSVLADSIAVIAILLICGGIGYGISYLRKQN